MISLLAAQVPQFVGRFPRPFIPMSVFIIALIVMCVLLSIVILVGIWAVLSWRRHMKRIIASNQAWSGIAKEWESAAEMWMNNALEFQKMADLQRNQIDRLSRVLSK